MDREEWWMGITRSGSYSSVLHLMGSGGKSLCKNVRISGDSKIPDDKCKACSRIAPR